MKMWKPYPTYTVVADILKKKGSVTDEELLEAVRTFYKDVSVEDLNKVLMKMEIAGLITVSNLMRGKRLIELRRT
ncbi:hypothetical protein CW711_07055 [Candidatus Bathyarchaeota archaeon]|nr:MAG: hypothetical protein B6U84_05640 [Candidatus Bathyarchaeota archaeon ex4484_40]RJS67673.1 MAG: hypothetical protein CW680_02345 [Candidatus Bathyarchaeota archaeon]RJS77185.1 MAG: hypothetical protein CW711_07055 [Candidatus Bathyarchaeota archaeon]